MRASIFGGVEKSGLVGGKGQELLGSARAV